MQNKKIVKPVNVRVKFPVSEGLEIALKRPRCTDDDVNCYTNELPARHSWRAPGSWTYYCTQCIHSDYNCICFPQLGAAGVAVFASVEGKVDLIKAPAVYFRLKYEASGPRACSKFLYSPERSNNYIYPKAKRRLYHQIPTFPTRILDSMVIYLHPLCDREPPRR